MTRWLRDQNSVASGYGAVVETQVGREAATDVHNLITESDQPLIGPVNLYVAARQDRLGGSAFVVKTIVRAGDGLEPVGLLIGHRCGGCL